MPCVLWSGLVWSGGGVCLVWSSLIGGSDLSDFVWCGGQRRGWGLSGVVCGWCVEVRFAW